MNSITEKTGVTLTLPTLIGLCVGLITIGGTVDRVLQQEKLIHKVESFAKEYVEQEVGGLRSDWERDRTMQNKRLDKLEQ